MKIATAIAITLIASSVHAAALTEDQEEVCYLEGRLAASAIISRYTGTSASDFLRESKEKLKDVSDELLQDVVIEAFDPGNYPNIEKEYASDMMSIQDKFYIRCIRRMTEDES